MAGLQTPFSCMLQYAQLFFIRARFPVRAPANKYTFFIKFQLYVPWN